MTAVSVLDDSLSVPPLDVLLPSSPVDPLSVEPLDVSPADVPSDVAVVEVVPPVVVLSPSPLVAPALDSRVVESLMGPVSGAPYSRS